MLLSSEKLGGRPHPRYLLEGFGKTIMECGLVDMGFIGSAYTWEKSRGTTSWIQERLDMGFANHGWRMLFPNAELKVLEVSTSDHLPLFLNLNTQVYIPKTKRFRFENIWVKEDDCFNLVRNSWNAQNGVGILQKIDYCCLKLDEWGEVK